MESTDTKIKELSQDIDELQNIYDKVSTRRMNKSLCTMWIYKLGKEKQKLEDRKLVEQQK